MTTKSIKQTILARTARTLTGARRVAMLLLAMVLTMTAQTAWARTIDLSSITEATIAQNGDVLTGTLEGSIMISIAAGATVTLNSVEIDLRNPSIEYAGITCLGNATIIIKGDNTIKGGEYYPGIQVAKREGEGDEYTLTIQGDGSLTVSSGLNAAGIGSGQESSCGNITISGGTITANGDNAGIGSGDGGSCGDITISGGTITATGKGGSPGIGSGNSGSCGNITISGGIVTAICSSVQAPGIGCSYGDAPSQCGNITISGGIVTATGGEYAPGIGNGGSQSTCGDITITSGITSVTVTKGSGAPYSIGKSESNEGTCGTVTINGVVGPVSVSPTTLIGLAVDGDIAEGTAGHYYVNMPNTGTNTLMLSDATVGTVKVYDDGGKSAPFSSSCKGTLVITAPAGYVINVEGEVTTKSSSYDFLYIFDSNEADFSKQLGSMAGDTDQGHANIDCTSTGNYMTLYFESSTEDNDAAGLDLTVTLKKDFTLCTATADNPMYHDGYNIGMFYDGTWNTNHGGIKVFDGETELTYAYTDPNYGNLIGDYTTSVVSLDYPDGPDPCTRAGEHCQLILTGENDWAGTLTIDIEILPLTGNGTWGDNDELTWNFADGKLSITGTGAMKATDTYGKYPWYQYCSHITSITIGEGITSIAPYAFGGQNFIDIYSNVKTVTLPSTLTSIGDEAFRGCTGNDFNSVVIPAGVTSIGGNAFYGCTGVAHVYCYADPTKLTWGDTGDDFKSGTPKTTCHVADKTAWSSFSNVNVTFEGDLAEKSIPYIDADGNTQYCTDFTALTGNENSLAAGWYVVNSNVNYTSTIELTGAVNLILADDKTMSVTVNAVNADAAITSNYYDYNLTIYGQSAGTGTLTATNQNSFGWSGISVNELFIYGGTVNATATDIDDGYGIDAGNVYIYGGAVSAKGSVYGIYAGSNVYIYGGTVNAEATGDNGGAIKASYNCSILGGQVDAKGYASGSNSDGIYVSDNTGKITLGWSANTDRIYVSSYDIPDGTVSIADGKAFTDGTNNYLGTLTDEEVAAIEGKTLQPISGVALEKDGSGKLTATLDPTSTVEVSIPAAIVVNHIEISRIYEKAKASTVYLPFRIAYNKMKGGTFNKFTGVNEGTTPWTVIYTQVESGDIKPNTPYIFLPDGSNGGKIVVDNGDETIEVGTSLAGEQQKAGDWEFIGTHSRIKWTHDTTDPEYTAEREAEIGSVYGFAANDSGTDHVGDFVKVGNNVWINPERAYLKRTPAAARAMTAGNETQQLPDKMRVVIVKANGETTEIGTLDTRTGEISLDEWYSLDGRRLSGKPTKSGLYINNGKKVLVP